MRVFWGGKFSFSKLFELRIGIYIQPWIDQQAGIHQFARQLAGAVEQWGTHEYVLIGSERVDSPLEQYYVDEKRLQFISPKRWLPGGDAFIQGHFDWIIDPSHFGTLGLVGGNTKVCAVIHDIGALIHPDHYRKKTVWGHRLFLRKVWKRSEALIAISKQTETDLQRIFGPSERLFQYYRGLPAKVEVTADKRVLERFSKPFFLTVGTIEPRKNHERLLEAFDLFCESNEEAELVIVGPSGWKVDMEALHAHCKHRDRVHQLGFVSPAELRALYQNARAMLYPSLFEGFGLPILEAMAEGCPVVTSNRGAMSETAGDAAFLVCPESSDSIAQAMEQLSVNASLREGLKEKGLQRAQDFSWKEFVGRLEAEVLKPGGIRSRSV